MGKLEGKIALVIGSIENIGLATAKQFVNEGAYVFISGDRENGVGRGREGDREKCRRRTGRGVKRW
jgi:NAD(P)-dependent dehydrogenase (short-subunit alcohol dehydrogenase family)